MQVVDANGNMFGYDSITVAGPDGRPKTISTAIKLVTLVRNTSGSTITKGTVVYINGGSGNKPTIAKALATSDATSAQTYGVVQANIPNNKNGYAVVIGALDGLNTSAYAPGTQLYLSSTVAGEWTSTRQLAPAHLVYVAIVTRQHVNQGVVEVKIQNGYELEELHDVSITSVANDQVLQYESSTQLWKNKTISTGITIGTTTIVSGTVGRVLFQGAGNVVQQAAGLFYDAPNVRFGVGTSSPAYNLDVVGNASITTNLSVGSLGTDGIVYLNRASTGGNVGGIRAQASGSEICGGGFVDRILCSNGAGLFFYTYGGSGSVSTQRMQIFGTSGNVLIQSGGTFTDAGFKLDVNGSVTFRGELRLNANIATGGNRNYLLGNSGDFEVTTNTAIKFRNYYNASDVYFSMNYGLGGRALFSGLTSANGYRLATSGNVIPEATVARGVFFNNTLVAAANNDVLVGLDIAPTFANGAFTGVSNYVARLGGHIGVSTSNAFGLNYISFNALTSNQGISAGFSPNGTPTGYAYNFQFSKSSTANTNGLLFIGGGASAGGNSANKHVISTSADGTALGQQLVLRVATTSQSWSLVNDHLTIFPTGNVVIQNASQSATDAGFRLDVNGTVRSTSTITGNNIVSIANMWCQNILYGTNFSIALNGQTSIGAGGFNAPASALLAVTSTTQGFLPPRMTNAQMLAIATPAEGLVVYDTTNRRLCCYDGATWQNLF